MQTPEQPLTPPAGGPPPASPPPATQQAGQHGMSIAALVCGIVALATFWCFGLGAIPGILAIVFGALGRGRNRERGVGTGMPTAGLVCGIIAVVLVIIWAAFVGLSNV